MLGKVGLYGPEFPTAGLPIYEPALIWELEP